VAHSLSPLLHSGVYQAYSIDAEYLRIESKDFAKALKNNPGLFACSVTSPLKEQAAECCYKLDEISQKALSVNTILRTLNGYVGSNTDGPGLLAALDYHLPQFNAHSALIFGGGPTARSIALALLSRNCSVRLAVRSPEKLESFSKATGIPCEQFPESGAVDLLINATSIFRQRDSVELSQSLAAISAGIRFSVHYQNWDELLFQPGITSVQITGLELLIFQAHLQISSWFGIMPDYKITRRPLEADYGKLLYADSNAAS